MKKVIGDLKEKDELFSLLIEFDEHKTKEAKFAYSNHFKAKKYLDFQDDTDLEKVITNMFQWALTLPKNEIKNLQYEINKKIYTFWGN